MAFASKVNVTIFILMKTVLFICRGRNVGIANINIYMVKQEQARTYRDRKVYIRTHWDRHGQTGTFGDKQGLAGTDRVRPCFSLLVPACPC